MKNLKRVLSLGLASVMLLGMMVVGASAKDFTDGDKITHVDAVNTLVALNVIKGKEDGSYFDPEGTVTRGEMAKMIAVAMNGGNEEAPGVKMTPTFTDISGHWAEPFIEYCADMGIISGRGDGTFDPNGNVTGLEVAKMVLTAMGYNSEAYQLTGATWAVRTNEVAQTAYPKGLYQDLTGVSMNAAATRDTSAQLIWNGLTSNVVTIQPVADKASTGLEWQYGVDKNVTLLKQRYNAETVEGTYMGNSKSISGLADGEIRVNVTGGTFAGNHNFPSDLGIENIGEEVRIVWKNGTRSSTVRADKNDIIYGCFNTGRSEVYNITKDDIQNAKSDAANHIKFGDELHEAETSINVVTDYVGTGVATPIGTINGTSANQWRDWQNADQIKFVCDPDSGKINRAFVVTVNAGKVSGVTSSKVTISGLGTIEIDKNDVYDDIAKDDVVIYTRFYNNTDLDKAFVTVTKAESVEGELTGYKYDSANSVYIDVVVDGDTYKVESKAIRNLTDDAITAPDDSNVGDKVALYLMDNKVVAVQSIEETGGKYALVTDTANESNDVGGNIKGGKIRVLLPDGTSETVYIHKDSKKDAASTPTAMTGTNELPIGTLIEYASINNGAIKIKTVANSANVASIPYADFDTVSASSGAGAKLIWDKDSKTLTYGSGKAMVAAADAVLFVGRSSTPNSMPGVNGTFKAYSLRDLGSIKIENNTDVAVYTKGGLVKAVAVALTSLPKSTGASTYYGIVSKFVGTRVYDDTEYHQYKIAVNEDEQVVVNVEALGDTLAEKQIVTFGERADGLYENADFDKLVTWAGSTPTVSGATAIAVNKYDENRRLLTFWTDTSRASSKEGFVGGTADSYTVDKDVKIVFINANDKKDGESIGVSTFNGNTGYANALITVNDDGLVDAIIVETSEKVNWDTTNFAQVTTYTLTNSNATIAAAPGTNGAYTVALSDTSVENGDTVTVTVTCSGVDTANTAKGEKVTVTYNGGTTKDLVFTAAGSQSFTFAPTSSAAVSAAVTAVV